MGAVIPTLKDFYKLAGMKVAGTQWMLLFCLVLTKANIYEMLLYAKSSDNAHCMDFAHNSPFYR